MTGDRLRVEWYGPRPELPDGEAFVVSYAANRTQGKRAVGGALHITTRRVLFQPNSMESSLGGNPWSCTRDAVLGAGIQPRRFSLRELFSGGLVDRLVLVLVDGGRELFVVNGIKTRLDEICSSLGVPIATDELPSARVIKQ